MLLSDYLHLDTELDEHGVFDPILNSDSFFFINLQRLKQTKVPEFANSYQKIRDYFKKVIKILDHAKSKDPVDICYKQALRSFNFSEVNNLCLGYAAGTKGAGFGSKLASQIISTAFDIVKEGILDPEIFELLPLFQDNVGADRLSDMIATLILEDIKLYTQRINRELSISQEYYSTHPFVDGYLINPYKQDVLYLVPVDILHNLPVAECWEDVEHVVYENSAIRDEINIAVAAEWKNYTSKERKEYICDTVFKEPAACNRVLAKYKQESLEGFNPQDNIDYRLSKLEQSIDKLNYDWHLPNKKPSSYSMSKSILEFFKDWVENQRGWKVIQEINSRYREKCVQFIFLYGASSFIKANDLDISCEADEGRGPVDFKISRGQDKTIVEVKLSSNHQYLHGFTTQIIEYGKAEHTDSLIYVYIDLGNPGRTNKLQATYEEKKDEGNFAPELVIIDATGKESASIYDFFDWSEL